MIAFIFLILTGTVLGVIFKLFGKYKIDNFQAIVVNYLTCLALGASLNAEIPFNSDAVDSVWFPYVVLLGILFILGFNLTAVTFQKFGVALTTVMQKMSLVLTVIVTIIVFGETAYWLKVVGIIVAVVAIFMVNRKSEEGQPLIIQPKILVFFPALVLIFSSIVELVLFYVEHRDIVGDKQMSFTTHCFGMAAIFGSIVLITSLFLGKAKMKKKNIIAGVILGIPNYFSIYLLTVTLSVGFEASVVFPLLNVSVLFLSALLAWKFFHEKLSPINWWGIVLSIVAICMIALSVKT